VRCWWPTPTVRNLIKDGKTHQLRKLADDGPTRQGMITLEQFALGIDPGGPRHLRRRGRAQPLPKGHRARASATVGGPHEKANENATRSSIPPTRPSAVSRTTTASTRAARALARSLSICTLCTPQHIAAVLGEPQHGEHKPLGQRRVDARHQSASYDIARAVATHGFSLELVDLGADHSRTRRDQASRRVRSRDAWWLSPLHVENDRVVVAVAVPSDRSMTALQRAIVGRSSSKVAAHSELLAAIASSYRALSVGHLPDPGLRGAASKARRADAKTQVSSVSEDAPVVQVVQQIITQALRGPGHRDIHIEPQSERVRVRYRIDWPHSTTSSIYRSPWVRPSPVASRSSRT